ncbi:MAG: hypothetical protein KC442_14275 [Thermomicrobiales bacterium]|nr:hypothetical protein [Thermomicrobiales bacterium]
MPTGACQPSNNDPGAGGSATVTVGPSTTPFAWQDGRRLWLLDGRARNWVLAELVFDPSSCRYLEVRRTSYRWPREAAGALLGRTIASGQGQAENAARGLVEWAARANAVL